MKTILCLGWIAWSKTAIELPEGYTPQDIQDIIGSSVEVTIIFKDGYEMDIIPYVHPIQLLETIQQEPDLFFTYQHETTQH